MKHSILIVDDNAAVSSPMKEYFERAGYDVRAVSSAQEAVTALGASKNYSLVITDLRMETGSEADGLGLVRQIRTKKPGLPVFVLTASGAPEAATESYRLRVDKFIGKPVSMHRLLKMVEDFLAGLYGRAARSSPKD